VEKCCTVFPSATISGHASINTGLHPGLHGLIGQSWYDRRNGEYIGYDFELTMPDNWIDASSKLSDEHLLGKTWFEFVKEYNIKSFSVDLIRKGADFRFSFIKPGLDRDLSGVARKLMFLRRFSGYKNVKGKNPLKKLILKLFPFHAFQNEVAVMNSLKGVRAGCRFGVTWFMETDAASHIFGPESFEGEDGRPLLYDSFEDALKDTDEELEKMYRGIKRIAGETAMLVISDHGQSFLKKGKRYHVDLVEELENSRIPAFSKIDLHEFGKHAKAVVAVSGPRMAHVYALSDKERIFDVLRNLDCVELVILRKEEGIYVHHRNEIFPLEEIGEHLSEEEYPFAYERIAGLMRSERCGDFVVTAKKGYEFQRGENKGGHGGLNFEDSVSFAVAHVPWMGEREIEFALSVDVVRMVFEQVYGTTLTNPRNVGASGLLL
jgi:predicted AlkP superfamily pyrophosphatase or phosphodiesterase